MWAESVFWSPACTCVFLQFIINHLHIKLLCTVSASPFGYDRGFDRIHTFKLKSLSDLPHLRPTFACYFVCVCACPCFCYLSSTKILMLLAKWEHFCKVGPFSPVITNSEDWGFRSVGDRVIFGTFVARGASSVMCNLYESPHKGRNASMCVYMCVWERERQHSGPHQFLCRAECEGRPSPYFWEEVGSEMLLKPACCHCW